MGRDMRSYEIRRKLEMAFPNYTFRVKCKKYAGGESFEIYTDMLNIPFEHTTAVWRAERDFNNATEEEKAEFLSYRKRLEENKKAEEKIMGVVKDYEKIDYDKASGEILSGGNTFVFVHYLKK